MADDPASDYLRSGNAGARIWAAIDRLFPGQAVANIVAHDYDQSIELYFRAETPAGWMPTEAQLRGVCELGFVTVYGNFADDTEVVGGWKQRIENGARVPGGDYWVASPGRAAAGMPRWQAGMARRAVVLEGDEVDLFREFLAWRQTKG